MKISRNDEEKYSKHYWTKLINSLSGFKSANLIGTVNTNGEENLSIVSSVVHLGARPPLMGMIFRPAITPRHSLMNIISQKIFTINHVNNEIFEKAHQTSARYLEGESEFIKTGLTSIYREGFRAPFVEESKIQLAMQYIRHFRLEENDTEMVIAEIKSIYLPDDILKQDGYLDLESAGTVALSGLDSYHSTTRNSRLSYAKPNKPLDRLSVDGLTD